MHTMTCNYIVTVTMHIITINSVVSEREGEKPKAQTRFTKAKNVLGLFLENSESTGRHVFTLA